MSWQVTLKASAAAPRTALAMVQWRVRAAVARALLPRRVVRSRGVRFTLQCDNWITYYRWRSYNWKEPETLAWIDTWLRDGDVFLDVGANIGVYTVYAAARRPGARIMALEPEFANLHLLRDNIVANRLSDRVEAFALALGAASGLGYLHVRDLTPGAALHSTNPAAPDGVRSFACREGVAIMTMDDFCRETGVVPNLVKIDVDGVEADILEGGGQTLRSSELRSILIEAPEDRNARVRCEEQLQEAGFVNTLPPDRRRANAIWARPRYASDAIR
jgi:FkbM family methyltransferase